MTAEPHIGLSRRNVRRGLLSSGLANLVALPLSLIVLPVILRQLSPAEYGVWAAVSTVVLIGGLADLGVAAEITRRVAAGLGTGSARASARRGLRILTFAAVVAVVIGELAAPQLVDVIFGAHTKAADQALPLLRASLVLMAVSLVTSGLSAVLQGLQRSDIVNIVTAASGVVAVVLVVTTIGALEIWALVLSAGVVVAVQLVAFAIRAHQLLPPSTDVAPHDDPGYFRLSLLVLVPSLCNVVDWQLDKLLIAHFVGPSATAGYQVGSTIVLELRNVLLLPLGMMLPALAEKRRAAASSLLPAVRTVFFSATGLLFGGLIVLGPQLANVWLGTTLESANTSLQWLSVALAINCATAPLYFHALATLRHSDVAWSAVCNAVVNGAVSWSLVPWLGLKGPLLGSVLGNVVGLVALTLLLRRRGETYPAAEATLGTVLLATAVLLAVIQVQLGSPGRWVSGTAWCLAAAATALVVQRRLVIDLLKHLRSEPATQPA